MEKYLPPIPLYYSASTFPVGKNIGHAINDPTQGMPEFTSHVPEAALIQRSGSLSGPII